MMYNFCLRLWASLAEDEELWLRVERGNVGGFRFISAELEEPVQQSRRSPAVVLKPRQELFGSRHACGCHKYIDVLVASPLYVGDSPGRVYNMN
jgi:hypothetical protein